jgi:starch phosphorylase
VLPKFYDRGPDGLPREWTDMMRAGLRDLLPVFNSHRMVQEYDGRYYQPCSRRYIELSADNMAGAKELAEWRRKLMTGWQEVEVVHVDGDGGRNARVGDRILVTAHVRLGSLDPDDVSVEAYYGPLDHRGDFSDRETVRLEQEEKNEDYYIFRGGAPCNRSGRFGFTVRVTPSSRKLENPFTMGMVKWAG